MTYQASDAIWPRSDKTVQGRTELNDAPARGVLDVRGSQAGVGWNAPGVLAHDGDGAFRDTGAGQARLDEWVCHLYMSLGG